MQICSVFTTIVNFFRNIDPTVLVCIIGALIIIGFLVFKKSIKVNYNAKDINKLNFAWFLLTLIIFAFAVFLIVINIGV